MENEIRAEENLQGYFATGVIVREIKNGKRYLHPHCKFRKICCNVRLYKKGVSVFLSPRIKSWDTPSSLTFQEEVTTVPTTVLTQFLVPSTLST